MAAPNTDALTEILDSSPTGVVISTLEDGGILYVNDVMAAFLGVSRAQALRLTTTSFFVNPADRAKVRDTLARDGQIRKLRINNRAPSGRERVSTFSSRLITYGKKPAVLSWLEDETERDAREHEILSASKQVELLHQIAGVCNRAVNFYDALRKGSAEIAKALGWPVSVVYRQAHGDVRLLELSSLSLPKDEPAFEFLRGTLVGRAFKAGDDIAGKVLATREILWIDDIRTESSITRFSVTDPVRMTSALGIPIVADDAVVAVLEFLTHHPTPRDERMILTLSQVSAELARVYLRDQMTVALQEARAEAESSSRAKASFLAAMSHEVRTPMNGVVGMVDLVLRTKLDDEQRFMLQTVKDSGHALIKVINDVLDFSKIEAGRLEIEAAPFSLTKTVEAVALSLAPAAQKKHLALTTYIDPRLPEEVMGDAVRVHQILSNLGSNAVKFSTAGEIVIRAERMAESDGKLRVRFSVRDEGIGIAAEALQRLFEEFQQADTSTTRRFGGTGLGLAICQRLTTLMNGEIGVESMLGAGSEFHCELPFGITAAGPQASVTANLAGLRVAVVAESLDLRDAARAYLEFWQADVRLFNRLRDCLASLHAADRNAQPFDVVVIPEIIDARQIAAFRQGLTEAATTDAGKHFPRLVIGRDPHAAREALPAAERAEITFLDINPVRRTALITAVAVAAGRASPEADPVEESEPVSDVAPPTVDQALAQGRLILVAEDHVANQDVLRRQLNRLGYACEIAEDGVAALALWRSKKYALLLTDCHMPNMDGFGLTAAIRKAEIKGIRAPIVAITANVLQGEAERCLAAGMDAFLPKPVELATLRATLAKWMSGAALPHAPAIEPPAVSPDGGELPVLDLGRIRDAFGEIDDGVREYFGVFLDSVRPLISQFEDELGSARHLEARETIHKAKGATANAGGKELASIMHDIETALVEQNYEQARRQSQAMRPAWDRLAQAIAQT